MSKEHERKDFKAMFKNNSFKISRVPIDSRPVHSRFNTSRSNSVMDRDFTIEEIEDIIRSGDLAALRELSRYYYRTDSTYRNNIDFLASLPFYYTMVTPIFESGKGSKAQIVKAFYNACAFVEKMDVKNTFTEITREWIKTGIFNGVLQERSGKVTIQSLPIEFCRTRYKDFNNLNILEFDLRYFDVRYKDDVERAAAILTFPEIVQKAWRKFKADRTAYDPWVEIPASAGGVSFCFAEDQSPLLIASIPALRKLKDGIEREERRDENELYKLLIQRMPIDSDGELVFELDEVAEIHAGVADMLRDEDTVEVLTTFGETTLENLQDSTSATQSADRIDKYRHNAWNALGRSELLFNADNSSSLTYSIKKDESLLKSFLNIYNTWIKYHLNLRFSRTGLTFDFEILPITMFNMKDFSSIYFQNAQFGYSKMYAGVANGIKQMDQISLMTFENDFLGMNEKMIPLRSSYTTSEKSSGEEKKGSSSTQSKDLNKTGGRPDLPDEEKSEKTQANIAAAG